MFLNFLARGVVMSLKVSNNCQTDILTIGEDVVLEQQTKIKIDKMIKKTNFIKRLKIN